MYIFLAKIGYNKVYESLKFKVGLFSRSKLFEHEKQ